MDIQTDLSRITGKKALIAVTKKNDLISLPFRENAPSELIAQRQVTGYQFTQWIKRALSMLSARCRQDYLKWHANAS